MLHAKLINPFNRCLATVLALTLLFGCQRMPVRDPAFAAARPALPMDTRTTNGAIYQAGYDVRLFEDIKARRIGDILIVRLVESTDASKSADTSADKSSSATIANPTLLGTSPLFSVPGALPLAATKDLNLETEISADRDFSGSGQSSQQNELNGNITVSVVEVLPNGNLIVRGEKRLTINNGNEYIRLSGIVRPTDIQSDNSVLSTQIADATIMYTGDGAVANSSIMGWLGKFFMSALFPF